MARKRIAPVDYSNVSAPSRENVSELKLGGTSGALTPLSPGASGELLVLEIPEPMPSVNRLHGRHWGRKVKMNKRWAWLTRIALCEARRAAEPGDPILTAGLWPLKRAVVRVIRHGPRLLDPDNASGGLKWMIDSLVREGILTNDSPKHLTLPPVEQHIDRKNGRTVVIVEAIP